MPTKRRRAVWETRMGRWVLIASVFLIFTGCGKNDIGMSGSGPGYSSAPLTQAPAPNFPQNPQSPQYPIANPPPFNPQLPAGMPQQFYPWLPMYHFFVQQPQISFVWFNIWNQWQIYARNYGCGIYNFPIFWNVYFPRYWNYGPYVQFYQLMAMNFYPWMGPGVILPPIANPAFFWSYYLGMPFAGFSFGGAVW